MSTIFSVWTVVVFVLFVGIVAWAWSDKRKAELEAAARIPFEEDDVINLTQPSGDPDHG